MSFLVLLKNAFANLARGGASALVALLLPPFLIRLLPDTAYSTWVLVLQLSAYVNVFDFGVQTAVGRYVAYTRERKDDYQCNQIVSTAFAILTGSSILALLLVIGLTWQLPNLFPGMPLALYSDARWSLVIVGGVLGIGLPFSVFSGIFIGLQRNEIPAAAIGGSKLLGAVFTVIAAHLGHSLIIMSIAVSLANLASYLLQVIAYKKINTTIHFAKKYISWQVIRELINYCFSLTIWSVGMLLITGLDTVIVGYFDYYAVPYYAAVAGLIAFLTGAQTAIFTALMPAVAALDARRDEMRLGQLFISSTRYGMFILLIIGIPLILFSQEILELWVGPRYAIHGYVILIILVVANIIRSSLIPYSILLVGTGQQRLLIISPLAEGFTNLIVSVIAGYFLGAIGVAIGTLIGAIVLWILCLFYNMPRTRKIPFKRSTYLSESTLQPLVCVLIPITILSVIKYDLQLIYIIIAIICLMVACILVWKTSLTLLERQKLTSYFRFLFQVE